MSGAGNSRAARLARAQAAWAPHALVWASCSLALGTLALLLGMDFGRGLQRAADDYLGANLPTNAFDVVAPQRAGAAALWGDGGAPAEGELDAAAVEALAALDGVRSAEAAVDLRLPLVAEGGSALLGQDLRAELLVTGLSAAAAAPPPGARPFLAPFAEPPGTGEAQDADAPVPMVLHPGLLLTYNAAVAPSLGTPRLAPDALLGLRFTVRVGASHLPNRAPTRRAGRFVARIVGFSEAAAPLGASVPQASAERLWAQYAAATGPAPLARVRVVACEDAAVPRLQARVRRMGLQVDDDASRARAAVTLARKIASAAFFVLAALVLGYGAVALAGHWAASAADFALLGALGHARRTLLTAAALQGAAVGACGASAGAAASRLAEGMLQAGLQRAADPFGVRLPAAFATDFGATLAVVVCVALAAACGGASALARRLDKPARTG